MRAIRVPANPILTPGLLLRRRRGNTSSLLRQNGIKLCSLHASGRAALFEGLKILGCKAGDNVLLPAYICDSATYPFRELRIQMRFYEIHPSLKPDMADLVSKVDKKTKAVLMVNYFGFPQELEPVKDFCKKHKISLIEDNAHGLLSKKDSRLLGTFGDIGFSSIWKTLPTPNGGALFLNNDRLITEKPASSVSLNFSLKSDGFFLLYSLLTFLETKYGFPSWVFGNTYKKIRSTGGGIYGKALSLGASTSRVSVAVLERVDFEEIISRRRRNYNLWLEKVYGRKGVKVLFESLPPGVCPQVFPLIIEEGNFIEEVRSRGIAASLWPYLPQEVKGEKDYANFLAEHLFTLPVHQYVNQEYLRSIK